MAVATLAYRNLSGPGRTTVPSLSGLVWLGVLLLPSLAHARCAADALAQGAQSLKSAAPSATTALAAQTLSRACTFPAPVQQTLLELPTAPQDKLAAMDRRTVTGAQELWSQACPGGLSALSTALSKPGPDGRGELYAACALDRFGVASPDEFKAATGSLTLPVLVAWQLSVENHNPVVVRDLSRALAGIKN